MGKNLKGKEIGSGICQRKDGIYMGRYTDMYGKRKAIYNKSLAQLKRDLKQLQADAEYGKSVKENLTLDKWYERWMEIYKKPSVRGDSISQYAIVYRKSIGPYLGFMQIKDINKSHVQELINIAAEHGYKYERQNKIKIIMRDMMQRALEDGLVFKNPVSGIRLLADRNIKARSLTICEQEKFFEACKGTFYENAFRVAVNTGLRPGELFALTRNDIDFERGVIMVRKTLVYQKYLDDNRKEFHIEPPKTPQSNRDVPINSECRTYLLRQLELKKIVSSKSPKEQNDYLFTTKFNTPLNAQIFNQGIHAVIRDMNLLLPADDQFQNFSGHRFRHTFATRLFDAGVEPKVVQEYLGHATLKMTMDLYTHVTEDRAKTDIEKIVQNKIIEFPA